MSPLHHLLPEAVTVIDITAAAAAAAADTTSDGLAGQPSSLESFGASKITIERNIELEDLCCPSVTHDPSTDRVYVFGGSRTKETQITYHGDLYVLVGLSGTAPSVIGTNKIGSETRDKPYWVKVSPSSNAVQKKVAWPSARHRHSATLWKDDKLVVFGGNGQNANYFNDVLILDLKTYEWSQPVTSGPQPKPRALHASVIVNDYLVIFGGVNGDDEASVLDDLVILNLNTRQWHRPVRLFQRYLQIATVVQSHLPRLFIIGGRNHKDQLVPPSTILSVDLSTVFELSSNEMMDTGDTEIPRIPVYEHKEMRGVPDSAFVRTHSAVIEDVATSSLSGHLVPTSRWLLFGRTQSTLKRHHEESAHPQSEEQTTHERGFSNSTERASNMLVPRAALRPFNGHHYHPNPPICRTTNGFNDNFQVAKHRRDSSTLDVHRQQNYSLNIFDSTTYQWRQMCICPPKSNSTSHVDNGHWSTMFVSKKLGKAFLLGRTFDENGDNVASSATTHPLMQAFSHLISIDLQYAGLVNLSNNLVGAESPLHASGTVLGDVAGLFNQPDFSDFVVYATGNTCEHLGDSTIRTPIYVHKAILLARWNHFRVLIRSGMKETTTSSLKIPERPDVVMAFFEYLYTDKLPVCIPDQENTVPNDNAMCAVCQDDIHNGSIPLDTVKLCSLLRLAVLYDVPRLCNMIVHVLLNDHISTDSAPMILQTAFVCHQEYLKDATLSFIVGQIGQVGGSIGWHGVDKDVLVHVLREISCHTNPFQ